MFQADWWLHSLLWGSVAGGAAVAVLIVVVMRNPHAFITDFPKDIQAAAAPATAEQERRGKIGGLVFVSVLYLGQLAVPLTWALTHADAGYWELAVMSFIGMTIACLFDLVIMDWLVVCTIRPRAIVFPGTEDCEGWGDYAFHVREQLSPVGLAAWLGSGPLMALIAWGIGALAG